MRKKIIVVLIVCAASACFSAFIGQYVMTPSDLNAVKLIEICNDDDGNWTRYGTSLKTKKYEITFNCPREDGSTAACIYINHTGPDVLSYFSINDQRLIKSAMSSRKGKLKDLEDKSIRDMQREALELVLPK